MARARKLRRKKKYVFTAARRRALRKAQLAAKRSRHRGGRKVRRSPSHSRRARRTVKRGGAVGRRELQAANKHLRAASRELAKVKVAPKKRRSRRKSRR